MLMVILMFVTPIIGSMREIAIYVAPETDFDLVFKLVSQVASPILSFLTFLILYRFLPNTKVTLKDVWIGALIASIAFDGAKWGFLWYVSTFPVYNVVYGSVGAVMALLTWVYVSSIILLFGALATSRYTEYAAKADRDLQGFKLIWTGLSRVRLRVVALPGSV